MACVASHGIMKAIYKISQRSSISIGLATIENFNQLNIPKTPRNIETNLSVFPAHEWLGKIFDK